MNIMQSGDAGRTPADLRLSNLLLTADMFFHNDAVSAKHVASHTGLSRTAACKILAKLVESGFITCFGKGASTDLGGKKPDLYTLNPEHGHFVSVFFSGRICCACLFDLKLCLRHSVSFRSAQAMGRAEIMEQVNNLLRELLENASLSYEDISALAIHCGGIVDTTRGALVIPIQNPHWGQDFDVRALLGEAVPTELPIYVDNSCRFCGYSELLHQPGRYSKKIAVISTLDQFVGGCIIDHGQLVHGAHGLVGEFGHMVVGAADTHCVCGATGCFESLVSLSHLQKRAEMHAGYDASMLSREEFSFAHLFAAGSSGDCLAMELLNEVADYFARLIRNISLAYDPEEIVIQGVYGTSSDYFQSVLQAALSRDLLYPQSSTQLTFSPVSQWSAHFGAAAYCRSQQMCSLLAPGRG